MHNTAVPSGWTIPNSHSSRIDYKYEVCTENILVYTSQSENILVYTSQSENLLVC